MFLTAGCETLLDTKSAEEFKTQNKTGTTKKMKTKRNLLYGRTDPAAGSAPTLMFYRHIIQPSCQKTISEKTAS